MIRFGPWFMTFAALASLPGAGARAADKPPPRMVDADGVKFAYYVEGRGEPVVLIHGLRSSASVNWSLPGISGLLAQNRQVIALDVRGHGKSDKPTEEVAYGEELVEDVVRLLDHLKIEKAHIVGYSMGGIIAGNFIAKHPERVLSGALGGMGWLKSGGAGQWGLGQLGKKESEAKAPAICGRSLAKLALTKDEIKTIEVPMIVFVGDKDRLVNRLYVEPLKQIRPDWRVVEIEDANHLSCVVREQFREELAAWLDKNSKQGEADKRADRSTPTR